MRDFELREPAPEVSDHGWRLDMLRIDVDGLLQGER
jgi:hypothetical protein